MGLIKVTCFVQASKEGIFALSRLAEAYHFLEEEHTYTDPLSPQENLWNKENTVNSPTGFGQHCIGLWENQDKKPFNRTAEVFIKRSGLVGWSWKLSPYKLRVRFLSLASLVAAGIPDQGTEQEVDRAGATAVGWYRSAASTLLQKRSNLRSVIANTVLTDIWWKGAFQISQSPQAAMFKWAERKIAHSILPRFEVRRAQPSY